MITRPASKRGRLGSRSTASATLVSGASVTSVSLPGFRQASSTIRSGLNRADNGILAGGSSA